MTKALYAYVKQEVLPRWKLILFSTHFWIAIAATLLLAYRENFGTVRPDATMFQFASAIRVYAGIVVGFSITSLSMVLSRSSGSLANILSKTPASLTRTSYADLIFVFTWTALLHWLLLISGFAYSLLAGDLVALDEFVEWLPGKLYSYGFTFLTTYSLCQFLILLLTLGQFAHVYFKDASDNSNV